MRRRLTIVAAVIMAVILAYMFFIAPLSEKRKAIKESLQAKYITLQKYEAFLKVTGKTELEFDSLAKEVAGMEDNVLQDASAALAFAKFQGHIQDFADKSGMKIISIRPLSVVKYKHYFGLPIQFEASGGIGQLGEFMKQIDSTKKFVRIDRLNISAINAQMPGELRIRMQVSGLMRVSDS